MEKYKQLSIMMDIATLFLKKTIAVFLWHKFGFVTNEKMQTFQDKELNNVRKNLMGL